ncbi:hypothetical protein [Methanogenium cariaci]|uniref:hypothetical protein n=1 Tax=Methanogenium cariaci TaxID=2197 RepID=UPI001FE01F5B|nr:hypothetical protein [Methanogenium cariaci]
MPASAGHGFSPPRYEKVTIGIDDTDTKEEGGATWVLASQCAEHARLKAWNT